MTNTNNTYAIAALVRNAQDGSENAFKELYYTFYQPMVRYTITHFADYTNEAEGIVNNAFTAVFKRINSIHNPKAFPAILKQEVRSQMILCIRKSIEDDSFSLDRHFSDARKNVEGKKTSDPSKLLRRHETVDVVHRALNTLPRNQRLCIVLNTFNDLTPTEIAQVLPIDADSIRSLIQSAKENMRYYLTHCEVEY